MKALGISGTLAVFVTFGTTMAVAQAGDGTNSITPQSQYSFGKGAAYVGDGSDPHYLEDQQRLLLEPGYSIGTGSAAKNTGKTHNQNATGQNTNK